MAIYLFGVKRLWRPDWWPQYVTVIGAGIVGMVVGNLLHGIMDSETVVRSVLLLLTMAGVVLLNPPIYVTGGLFVVMLAAFVAATGVRRRYKRKDSSVQFTLVDQEAPDGADDVEEMELEVAGRPADGLSSLDLDASDDSDGLELTVSPGPHG